LGTRFVIVGLCYITIESKIARLIVTKIPKEIQINPEAVSPQKGIMWNKYLPL